MNQWEQINQIDNHIIFWLLISIIEFIVILILTGVLIL